MKGLIAILLSLVASFWLAHTVVAADTHSGQAVEDSVKASTNASGSAAHSVAASGQVTSAASAAPLMMSGAVGAASGESGEALMQSATAPIGTPLEITDEAIMAGPPPDQALMQKETNRQN